MAKSKEGAKNTFAILKFVEKKDGREIWSVYRIGLSSEQEATSYLKSMRTSAGMANDKYIIVDILKGMVPKIEVVLQETETADIFKDERLPTPNNDWPVVAEVIEGPATGASPSEPVIAYVEPAGSDPTPCSNESRTPTCEQSGHVVKLPEVSVPATW